METYQYNEIIKVIFVGPPAVGKSCLLTGFTPQYNSEPNTQLLTKYYEIAGKMVRFEIWDIPASIILSDHHNQYCKIGQIVACVYSINDKNSFKECQNMIEVLFKQNKLRYDAKFALISNKNDLQQLVSHQQGSQMANILKGNNQDNTITHNYFEVSTKNNNQTLLQQLCKGFYSIWKDDHIKNATQLQQSNNPAPPQPIQPIPTPTQPSDIKKQNYHMCKVIILGDHHTGKTSLIKRFVDGTFTNEYQMTIGVDLGIKTISIDEILVRLQIWDISSMKKFITKNFFSQLHMVILVYDCTNTQSFINLSNFIKLVNSYSPTLTKQSKYIVATKIDKESIVSMQDGEKFAKQMDYQFIRTSSQQNIGISELFYNLSSNFIKKLNIELPASPPS